MIIEKTKKEFIVRFPRSTSIEDLQYMTDLLDFRSITKTSKATQHDVDELVKKIKKGRWSTTKAKVGL